MTIQQHLEVILRKEDDEIKILYQQIGAYLESKEPKYRTIVIVNTNGNVAHQIQEETGFETFHKYPTQIMTSSRGSNYIRIPVEQYSAELEQKIKTKYEDC